MTQLNSRKKRDVKLDINGPTYLAIHSLVERQDPYTVYVNQNYTVPNSSIVKQRRREIKLDNPAPYEITLAKATATESRDVAGEYNIKIAAFFTIGRGSQKLLSRRPSGIFFYDDEVYFTMIWQDVLKCPLPSTNPSKRIVHRYKQFPTKDFIRREDGRKIQYLQKATPEQHKLIVDSIYENMALT